MQPSPLDIQSHLYASFLHASTYDVALRVSGTWNAIYKLHRVVLIQSGFFRSLFTSGFSESAVKLTTGTDEINITFDDLNITRAAFEICISRLYGGGPSLHVSPHLIPTPNHPLTPPFSGVVESHEVPPGSHPATPRFLQSLLATAIYLSIPSLASQALALIFKTIGPNTVLQYLNFACGNLASLEKDDAIEETQSAVGLEDVAQLLDLHEVESSGSFKSGYLEGNDRSSSVLSTPSLAESTTGGSDHSSHGNLSTTHHYGAVSDKIGEACVCWLARWATDMLQLEADGDISVGSSTRTRHKSLSSLDPPKIADILSDKTTSIKPPVIWGRGGLSAKWAAAVVSADTLFVKNERERYNFARSVVALRRCSGILEVEEPFWTELFEHGIYYSNMTFEDILFISQDMCPVTRKPYVPLSTLQASHWTQSILRHHILNRASVSSPGSPSLTSPRDKELGISLTTADILGLITKADEHDTMTSEKDKSYFPIFSDASLRIGDSGTNAFTTPTGTPLSMEDLFSPSHLTAHNHPRAGVQGTSLTNMSTTEENFFGIINTRYSGHQCVESDSTGKFRWSPFPPFRFSVEFWDIDLLKEKSRLHSQTIWHAGSLFNVYVQIVRKKGQAQLGIYLHRQSIVDIPACSLPSLLTQTQTAEDGHFAGPSGRQLHTRHLSLPSAVNVPSSPTHYSPSIHPLTRSTTPSANSNHPRPSSPPTPSSSPPPAHPPTLTTFAPQQPYRDPRASVSAYFAISCASATGSSQTRFSSSPDVFSVSQSWGWKSSTLRTEDFVGIQALPNFRRDENSFRATVLLGLV